MKVERLGAGGLCDELGAEVRRPDRIRLRHHGGPPVFVAADGEAEPEREDQPDEAEECRLEDADRLAQDLGVAPQVAPHGGAEHTGAGDDREDEERYGPAREREEHGATLRQAARCRRSQPGGAAAPFAIGDTRPLPAPIAAPRA